MLGFVKKGYITERIIKEKVVGGIHSRQIVSFSEYAKEIIVKDFRENRKFKTLPPGYALPYTKIIFGASVALISPLRENLIFIVESESFAKTELTLFDAL